MSRLLVILMATACGMMAANLYYAQPLIAPIGVALGFSPESAGLLVTLGQIGYCIGLLLVVPLADVVENRKLVTLLTGGAIAGLLVAGLAPNAAVFLAGATVAGICSVGAQVLVPLATRLSRPEEQGTVIGQVMLGLLSGIMLARPAASFVADILDWRAAFLLPAVALTLIGILMAFQLPKYVPETRSSYRALVSSLLPLFMKFPLLRRRGLYQAALFGSFNLFWTAAPLMLSDSFGLTQSEIALFALVGAGGALVAPIAGRLADRGLARPGTAIAMVTVIITFGLTWPALVLSALIPMVIVTLILDGAVQANQVLSQSVIYRIAPESRGRINAIYMTLMFTGGAIGSVLAPLLYYSGGWPFVVGVGAVASTGVLVFWLSETQAMKDMQRNVPRR